MGSRRRSDKEKVEKLINELDEDDIVVSGVPEWRKMDKIGENHE